MALRRQPSGFTLLELLIGMAIMLALMAAVFSLVNPAGAAFQVQPEAQDLQQRLRVAMATLQEDLRTAGAGMNAGPLPGPLMRYVAPILPYRTGERGADAAAGVFYRPDAISVIYVPQTRAQAGIVRIAPNAAGVTLDVAPNCGSPLRDRVCGFREGTRVLMVDRLGRAETGTVSSVDGETIHVEGPGLRAAVDPGQGGAIAEMAMHVYHLDEDRATGTPRLMRYDGHQSHVPAVDHVVGLRFEYAGDSQPPMLLPGADLEAGTGPWTTYGPRPPALWQDPPDDEWGAGENCVFMVVDGVHVPRLAALGAPGTLAGLAPAVLSDGPWCPGAADPNRFDADLLRVRRVTARIRVQAAVPWLRGPAGLEFVRGGSSVSLRLRVPDQEIRFDVAPRNMERAR